VHVPGFAADVGFVRFDVPAELPVAVAVQRERSHADF